MHHATEVRGVVNLERSHYCGPQDFWSEFDMEGWDRHAWVTHADYRQSHSVKDRFSGWSIGLKGPVAFRLYDKTLEIETQSHKEYLHPLWFQAGWFPGDPVWRAEFQLRRPTLASFGIKTLADALEARDGLWRYLTSDWLRLTVPNPSDDTRSRWPTHPLWTLLSQIRWSGSPDALTREYKPSGIPSDAWIARHGTSLLTSLMAKEGLPDLRQASERLREIVFNHWQERELWEGASADEVILEKTQAKERRYGMPVRRQQERQPGEEDLSAEARDYRQASRGGV